MGLTAEMKVKFTPETMERIRKQAETLGVPASTYVRFKILEVLRRERTVRNG